MRRILVLFCLLAGLLGNALTVAQERFPVAPPKHFVTDIPNFLTEETRSNINRRLKAYQQNTGHQVLLWIGTSTNGIPLEDWTVRTFAAWKVGRAKLDDGLILFIFTEDHKVRIEVGYGLEGQMPDATASQIIQEIIVPGLKQGNQNEAVAAGMDRILEITGGDSVSGNIGHSKNKPMGPGSRILIGILGLGILVMIIKNPSLAIWILYSIISGGRGNGSNDGDNGGGYSGGGGHSGGGGASGSW